MILEEQQLANTTFHDGMFLFKFFVAKSVFFKRL